MKNLRIFAFILLYSVILTSAACSADRLTCYTLWDDAFFYAAFEVQDPDVTSSNTTHMSEPWNDDCVEVFFETDYQRAPDRTPNTFQMSVSSGGGSSFLVGENGQPTPKTIFSFKYARRVQGTINRPYDKDIGYIIELAIPWKEMGGPPKPGQVMGFNVICRMQGEMTGFVSLSPDVQTEEDVHSPAKWGSIKFADTPTIIARENGTIICRKIGRQPPIINGTLGPGEWVRDMRFQMEKPTPPVKPVRVMVEKLALARYSITEQHASKQGVKYLSRSDDGSTLLTLHPPDGVGPWFTYDSVQWHKDHLAEMRNAGIDVALVEYGGSELRPGSGPKALSCMVQGLKELKAEGGSYPLIGLFLNTEKLADIDHGMNEALYAVIREFFLHVPDEFRAVVQVPADREGGSACLVTVGSSDKLTGLNKNTASYCNERFAEDFARGLVLTGPPSYWEKGVELAGYPDFGPYVESYYNDTGWINVAVISPGYEDWFGVIKSRMGGEYYRREWNQAVAKSPDWLFIDSWNDLRAGNAICLTAQYGNSYVGMTKINMLKFNGMRAHDAKFLRHDTPSAMLPGNMYQISLAIKNSGTKPWYAGQQGVFLACRWFKDGSLFSDTGVRLPFQGTVLAGQIVEKTMGIRTVDQEGTPLPEGEYELRWEMVRSRDEWFAGGGDTPLCVPVRIVGSGDLSPGFTLVDSTIPALMQSGSTYSVTVRIRNDGPSQWKAGSARIGYRWESSEIGDESSVALAVDVDPGRIIELTIPIAVKSEAGPTVHAIQWGVFDGNKWMLTTQGTAVGAVAIDYGTKFLSSDTPAEMDAGKKYDVNLSFENTGPRTWTKTDFGVGYRWHYLDGAGALDAGPVVSLPSDVKPAEKVSVKTSVIAPPYDGQYYLVFSLSGGEDPASAAADTGNTLVIPVNILKGRLEILNLNKLFDLDVISYDTDRKDGDADGKGSTLPAEYLPPLVTTHSSREKLWPSIGLNLSGFYRADEMEGPNSVRRIAFQYPPKADGAKNAFECKGQTIEVKSGRYSAAHLVILTTADVKGAEFGLVYRNGRSAERADFVSWEQSIKLDPSRFERTSLKVAFTCPHRHSPDGDVKGWSFLTHHTISADPDRELTAIALPNNPALKVLAVTLEKAQ